MILDTGAEMTTIKINAVKLKNLNLNYLEHEDNSFDVAGKSFKEREIKIPLLQMGNLQFSNFVATETEREFIVDGIVGNHFLNNFYVLVDFKGSRLVIYSKRSYPEELGLNHWGKLNFEHNNIGIILTANIAPFNRDLKFLLDTGCNSDDPDKFGVLMSKYLDGLPKRMVVY